MSRTECPHGKPIPGVCIACEKMDALASKPHPDTLRLEKLAAMMDRDFPWRGRGFYAFPEVENLIESELEACTTDDLRAWIDAQEVKP